jgi:hypothetical protein
LAEITYNNSKHSATGASPFFASHGFHPTLTFLPPSPDSSVPEADHFSTTLSSIHSNLIDNLAKATAAMTTSANRRRIPAPEFKIGDMVWVLRRHYTTDRPCKKFDVKRFGPYKNIATIGRSAFKLQLPPHETFYNTLHVSLLEPFIANPFPGREVPKPPPIKVNGLDEYIVASVLDSRIHRGKLQYFVDWEGYQPCDRSWLPAENLKNCKDLVRYFHRLHPDRPS